MSALAYHEAGHATIAIVRGIPIEHVTIAPTAHCRMVAPMGAHEASDFLVALMAGPAAECQFTGRRAPLAGEDFEQALAVASVLAHAALDAPATAACLERYRVLADATVIKYWPLIARVAEALARRTTLGGKDIQALMAGGGETSMRMDAVEKNCQREQRTRAAAAAAADGRAVGRGPDGMPAWFDEFMADIACITRDWVKERIAAAVQPLESRVVELEAREYQGVWEHDKTYAKGAMVTHDGSLWIARSASISVRPGTTPVWQLAIRKGRDGRDRGPRPE